MTEKTKYPFIVSANGGEIGERTELRFIEAVAVCTSEEPDWFLGVDEASSLLDVRGVDFIAWVKYRGIREPMPIPIQVKSSERGREQYYEKNPAAKKAGVVVLVIGEKTSPKGIRSQLFSELSRVRKTGLQYEKYLGKLVRKPARGNGIVLQKAIEERRARRNTIPAAPRTLQSSLVFLPPPLPRLERWYYAVRLFYRQSFGRWYIPAP